MIIGTTCKTNTVPLFSRARFAAVSSACIELSSKSTGQRILWNGCVIRVLLRDCSRRPHSLLSQCRAVAQMRVLVAYSADLYPIAPLAKVDEANGHHRRSTTDGR